MNRVNNASFGRHTKSVNTQPDASNLKGKLWMDLKLVKDRGTQNIPNSVQKIAYNCS